MTAGVGRILEQKVFYLPCSRCYGPYFVRYEISYVHLLGDCLDVILGCIGDGELLCLCHVYSAEITGGVKGKEYGSNKN